MKKLFFVSLTIIIFILFTSSIFFFRKQEKHIVRIGYLPIAACLPYFIGDEMGYFTEENLEVKPIRFETSQQQMDALLQGQIDVITSTATAIGLLVQEKSPNQFKVFGVNTNGTKNALDVLIVKKDSNIKSVKDLKSKKVGSFPGIQALTLLKKYFRENGLDPDKDVQIQEMKQDLHLQALDSGQVDAVLTYEPNATIGRQKGISRILVSGPFAIVTVDPAPTGIFAVSKSYIDKNPQAVKRLIEAFNKSMEYANNNQPEARKILPKFFPIEENIATDMPLPRFDYLQTLDKEAFQKLADVLFTEGILKNRIEVNSFLFD